MSRVLRHLPNLLTASRIVLVPPGVAAVLAARWDLALAVLFLAGASDALDGFLAKRFDWRSQLGALLDPVADKLLFAGMFVAIALVGLLPRWLVATIIGRDVVIVSGAIAYRVFVGPFTGRASRLSKLNTATALALCLAVLAAARVGVDYRQADASLLAQCIVVLGAIAFATTLLSGAHYVARWSLRARRAVVPAAEASR